MAEEVLVKESITNDMITGGERLARRLNDSQLQIDAMLWFYSPESNSWRFIIATPEVKEYGPRSVYQKIRRIISEIPQEDRTVEFDDIVVVDSHDPLIQLLRTAIRTGPDLSRIRFSRNVISGVLVDDAVIYKMV
jgi:hypothetical protein